MPYPCSERRDSGVHENSWRRTGLTQRNPINLSLLCPDQVKFFFLKFSVCVSAVSVPGKQLMSRKKTAFQVLWGTSNDVWLQLRSCFCCCIRGQICNWAKAIFSWADVGVHSCWCVQYYAIQLMSSCNSAPRLASQRFTVTCCCFLTADDTPGAWSETKSLVSLNSYHNVCFLKCHTSAWLWIQSCA